MKLDGEGLRRLTYMGIRHRCFGQYISLVVAINEI